MEWIGVPTNIKEYQGFIYVITNLLTGRQYVGKKFFWFKKTLPALKGKKRKRRTLVESDWMTYYGSNDELNADVKKLGEEHFERRIVRLCKDKWECTYYEAKLQFDLNVLLDKNYYNGLIRLRLRGRR